MRFLRTLTIGLAFLPGAALADEVWTTNLGNIVYESDSGDTAILSMPMPEGGQAYVYVPGLAGNSTSRGIYDGYWIDPDGSLCGAALTGSDGRSGMSWGHALVSFDNPAFPTGITVVTGLCFGDLYEAVHGTPPSAGSPPSGTLPPRGK